jgi:uncharacterized protein DUF4150
MGATVYANGMRVSGKASNNKSMGAMADVCLSPPSPPAGPIPLPYPNFSEASDTSDGSKTVKICGKEVGLKDASNYKSSKGDEAATRSFGMGVVSHSISGKTRHSAWSFDVKFEGQNAIRHMDLTTHNHGSTSNLAVILDASDMFEAAPPEPDCKELESRNKSQQAKSLKDGEQEGQTSVAAHYNAPGGTSWYAGAITPQNAISSATSSQFCSAEPQKLVDGADGKKKLTPPPKQGCGDKPFKFRKKGHSEAKIIQTIVKKAAQAGVGPPLGSLTMNIDWRPTGKDPSDRPCEDCKTLICDAIKECDLEIKLCAKGADKPAPMQCP